MMLCDVTYYTDITIDIQMVQYNGKRERKYTYTCKHDNNNNTINNNNNTNTYNT